MKVLLTKELGRLAKWLRILGIDAEYTREGTNSSVIIQALREGRMILTRNHHLPASRGIRIIILQQESIKEQLAEALQSLGIALESAQMFTRCTVCNTGLEPIEKNAAQDKVPQYVFETQNEFFTCPQCSRIYWRGTHWGNVRELLDSIKD